MIGRFEHKPFSDINVNDSFFDSLKADYPEFATAWFPKCVTQNRTALVFNDEIGIGAFIAMKKETEPILLQEGNLPDIQRLKISTFLLSERFRGQRLGEGALGLVLWEWQKSRLEEVYLTVFPRHDDLIFQLERFGFNAVGHNTNGEIVYLRSRKKIDFSDPYKSFPFLSPDFKKGGYLIVEDDYHDTLFPYSELKNTLQEKLDRDVANGISKVYIGQQWNAHYKQGEPVFIYRKYTGPTGQPRYKSCLTSYCVINDVIAVKRNGRMILSFEEFCNIVGNKSVFTDADLKYKFDNYKNLTVIRMLYCGYFGSGNNVNMDWLDSNNLWNPGGGYPADTQLTPEQCAVIWNQGGIDITNSIG